MVRIIVDSTADIPQQLKEHFDFVPVPVQFGDRQFLDGVDIDKSKFYEMLIESDVMPTTSQPNPDAFQHAYEKVVSAGDTAVVITVSSTLSGTCQSCKASCAKIPLPMAAVLESTT